MLKNQHFTALATDLSYEWLILVSERINAANNFAPRCEIQDIKI